MFQSPLASKLKKPEHVRKDHASISASQPTASSTASPILMSILKRSAHAGDSTAPGSAPRSVSRPHVAAAPSGGEAVGEEGPISPPATAGLAPPTFSTSPAPGHATPTQTQKSPGGSTPELTRPKTNFKQQLQALQSSASAAASATRRPWQAQTMDRGTPTSQCSTQRATLGGVTMPPPTLSLDEELEKLSLTAQERTTAQRIGQRQASPLRPAHRRALSNTTLQSGQPLPITPREDEDSLTTPAAVTANITPRIDGGIIIEKTEQRLISLHPSRTLGTVGMSSQYNRDNGKDGKKEGVKWTPMLSLGLSSSSSAVSSSGGYGLMGKGSGVLQVTPPAAAGTSSSAIVPAREGGDDASAGTSMGQGVPPPRFRVPALQLPLPQVDQREEREEAGVQQSGIGFKTQGVEDVEVLQQRLRHLAPELSLTPFQPPELSTSTSDPYKHSHPAEPAAIETMLDTLHSLQQQGAQLTRHVTEQAPGPGPASFSTLLESNNQQADGGREQDLSVDMKTLIQESDKKDSSMSSTTLDIYPSISSINKGGVGSTVAIRGGTSIIITGKVTQQQKRQNQPPARVAERLDRLKMLRQRGDQLLAQIPS